MRNVETKRPGRERAVRQGGAPEANAELAASLAYVRHPSNALGKFLSAASLIFAVEPDVCCFSFAEITNSTRSIKE